MGVGYALRLNVLHKRGKTIPDQVSPTELATLTNRRYTVLAGLAYLRGNGLIDSAGRPVRPRLPAEQPPAFDWFACALHDTLCGPASTRRQGIRKAIRTQRDWLTVRGYLPDPTSIRWTAVPVWLVVVLGVVRRIAGVAGHKPAGDLTFMLFALGFIAVVMSLPPAVTARGRAAANAGRRRYEYLNPKNSPAFAAYGPASVALAAALFGSAAVQSIDPTLVDTAGQLGFSAFAESGGSSGGGGCGGGGGGGGGGCGG